MSLKIYQSSGRLTEHGAQVYDQISEKLTEKMGYINRTTRLKISKGMEPE
jgi:hypothetical protein